MALNAYLTLKGQQHGKVQGSVTQKGREGSILVVATSHEIVSPRDPATGLATGRRQHKPFVITKPIDKSTPILRSMLVTNENITEWTLKFWRAGAQTGAQQQYYTVDL